MNTNPVWNLAEVYKWLNLVGDSYLSNEYQALLNRIRLEQQDGNLENARHLMERLIALCNPREAPEVLSSCAEVYYSMNEPQNAAELLHRARRGFVYDEHKLAVVCWMRGIVMWDIQDKRKMVIQDWIQAIQIFERIAKSRNHPAQGFDPTWHRRQLPGMQAALQDAINTEIIALPEQKTTT